MRTSRDTDPIRNALLAHAEPMTGGRGDFGWLVEQMGGARFVLIGEASHGTHEFYRIRAELTKRLIREKRVTAVAVEADWPDAWRVNRYVRGRGDDRDATEALGGFRRFPQWMWRNADVLDFVGWLREHNDSLPPARRVGFYGLDLYSLHASMEAVVRYLRVVDPEAAQRAVLRYGCFARFGDDPQRYGYAATLGLSESCERQVVDQLLELRRAAAEYARRDGRVGEDDLFAAEQNAKVAASAERYYRTMFGGHVASWNLRDEHMMETLSEVEAFLRRDDRAPRMVVWAHNSHLGDARATELGALGELNLGQLVRQRYPGEAFLIGFSTGSGTVTAAADWDEPAQRMTVRPALAGSWEAAFHETGLERFAIAPSSAALRAVLDESRLQRAIGVIYRPRTERQSHYFHTRLARQFDAVLHYDHTRAVEPLERTPEWATGEVPETWPTAL